MRGERLAQEPLVLREYRAVPVAELLEQVRRASASVKRKVTVPSAAGPFLLVTSLSGLLVKQRTSVAELYSYTAESRISACSLSGGVP